MTILKPPKLRSPDGLNPRQVRLAVSCRKLILTHLPTFCWQTGHQVLTMLEQVDELVEESLVKVCLHKMTASGEILSEDRLYPEERHGRKMGVVNVYRLNRHS